MRWYTKLAYGLMWLAARLPMRVFHALGVVLGWFFWATHDRKRRIVEANLGLVRTELDAGARRILAHACVRQAGISPRGRTRGYRATYGTFFPGWLY